MAISTGVESQSFERAIFGAFEEEIKKRAKNIVAVHTTQMAQELDEAATKLLAELGLRISRSMEIQTMNDRIIIRLEKN